jgi:hypothetical protein
MNDLHRRRRRQQRTGNFQRVLFSRFVIVRDYHYTFASEGLVILLTPLPRSLRVGGSWYVKRPQPVRVLFSFDNVNRFLVWNLIKPIEYTPGTVQVPEPPALAVWPPLAKGFRVEAHGLKEELGILVLVVIDGNDLALLVPVSLFHLFSYSLCELACVALGATAETTPKTGNTIAGPRRGMVFVERTATPYFVTARALLLYVRREERRIAIVKLTHHSPLPPDFLAFHERK